MAVSRQERRAEWERNFRSVHGVSSGTYYQMRRNAASRGISPKTFDRVAVSAGYREAKGVAITARTDPKEARKTAAILSGAVSRQKGRYIDDSVDWAEIDIPDDFDWWYH